MFEYSHRIQFFETDLMKITHHANYLRIAEEARVAWGVSQGVIQWENPDSALEFTVIETRVRHCRPSRFGDELKVQLEARRSGVKVEFQYKLWNKQELVAEIITLHAAVGTDLKVRRLSPALIQALEKETWNETWLSNL